MAQQLTKERNTKRKTEQKKSISLYNIPRQKSAKGSMTMYNYMLWLWMAKKMSTIFIYLVSVCSHFHFSCDRCTTKNSVCLYFNVCSVS